MGIHSVLKSHIYYDIPLTMDERDKTEAAVRVFFKWQHERRITKERERVVAAQQLSRCVIAAGDRHSVALRPDGSVACWGRNYRGQAPPAGVDGDFVAIAAGDIHSLALGRDGSVACLGLNNHGQAPPDGIDGDFIAIAAGEYHSLALGRDGNVACWGNNDHGQAPPAGVPGDL